MRSGYLREAIARLERARNADDPQEASELVKEAADILALVAELGTPGKPDPAPTNADGPGTRRSPVSDR